jgi:hypothetical protein
MSLVAAIWQNLSDEARKAARLIPEPNLKMRVLLVAARYLVLAKRAEREADTPSERGKTV